MIDVAAGVYAELFDLTPLPGGEFRVKGTGTHWIDIVPMIYSWRLITVPKNSPLSRDRGWCYFGTQAQTFIAAVLAAWAWDGADDSRPAGWDKDLQTGEYSARSGLGQEPVHDTAAG